MAAAAVNSSIQYGPADPTLPPPWTTLIDSNTGYLYYWNTETNVTQYEKPVPPLPVGPPPGTGPPGQLQAGAAESQKGGPVEMGGNAPEKAAVNSSNGQSIHGMNNSVVHSSGMVSNSQPNLHLNPGAITPGGAYGNFTSNTHGHSGGGLVAGSHPSGGHSAANGPGGHIPGSGPGSGHITGSGHGGRHMMENSAGGLHMTGSAPRNAPSMPGATVHMNAADNGYGGAVRPMHSGGGPPQGMVGGNMHQTSNSNRNFHSNMPPMQPKLAALPMPQMQQGMGGRHMPVHSRQMNYQGNSPTTGPGHVSSFKRLPTDYMKTEPEPVERPQMPGFMQQAPILDVDSYRRHHEITVNGDNVPAPFITFEGANFPPEIAREFHSAGFLAPTPIQAQSWPLALQGRDLVAIAKTGSGKTLGYLLPAFLHLGRVRANPQLGPVVLVLSPTRELATQIQDEAIKFGKSSRISCTCVYGGAPKGPQLRDLDKGADIVIATPGRLNDFLEVKKVSLRQVSYLVLDEADRMLDMGFEPQIRKIVKEIPRRRQTLMFTATWPKEVRKIAEDFMAHPVQVNIGNADELAANKAITQYVEIVNGYEKHGRLDRILRSQEPGSKIIIFCSTKKMCDQLARSLGRGFGAVAIHGDKSQVERDHVLGQFKNGRSPILVATDVAARGLDIKDIRVVINFDFPTGVEDYVHRIGRTGRAGASGVAYSFFTEQDAKHAKELIAVLEGANQKVPIELRNFAAKTFYPRGRGRWEAGGMGGRDGGRGGGFGANMGGRGIGGGRNDSYGGRGGWAPSSGHFDRRERPIDRYNDKDKSAGRDRLADDRSRSRDVSRKYGSKDRGRSYSRSPSRSWGGSRSRSRSVSRSRSRSRSFDRYSDDRKRRSPYTGRGSYRSRSPKSRSPHRSRTPPRHGKVAPMVAMDARQDHLPVPDGKLNSLGPSPFPSMDPGAMISMSHTEAQEVSLAAAPETIGTFEAAIQQLDQGSGVGALNGEDGDLLRNESD